MELIKNRIEEIKILAKKMIGVEISDERAFNFLTLQYFCFKKPKIDDYFKDMVDCITDGPNDGGIDYVFYDEEFDKLIIGQNKYSENIDQKDVKSEVSQIIETIENFYLSNTGKYNSQVQLRLQDGIDRLGDEYFGNIDIYFSSLKNFTSTINFENILKNVEIDAIKVFNAKDIIDQIDAVETDVEVVQEGELKLDQAKNFLSYSNDMIDGVILNVSSKSIITLYNKFQSKGLFNLNIRTYVSSNKNVDTGIKKTISQEPENFWFYNNGLTIACEDYRIDGNKIKLYNFSIVNGGQTTSILGTFKEKSEEFFVACKVIKKREKGDTLPFFNKIAESTNSQKPIQPRDLKANSIEMVKLQNLFMKKNIFFDIKRGTKSPKKSYKLKNDLLGQLIYSFVDQKPGTARSSKKLLFDNNKIYNQIFKKDYEKKPNGTVFLLDIVDLNRRFDYIVKDIDNNKYRKVKLLPEELNILKNSKFYFFAFIGLFYRVANGLTTFEEIEEIGLHGKEFKYYPIFSNYKKDDLDDRLVSLIKTILLVLKTVYKSLEKNGEVSSVSNLFKSDSRYEKDIISGFLEQYRFTEAFQEQVDRYLELFK